MPPGLCKVDEKRYAFFNRLYVLAQSQRLRPVIRFLSRRRFLRNNPKLLHVLLLVRVLKRWFWIFLDERAPRLLPLLIRRPGM